MSDIFISFANADRDKARRLAEALGAEGWSVFWSVETPVAKKWPQVIEDELTNAKCVVVLWSRESVNRDWVREEAEIAKNRGVFIQACLDETPPPFGFGLYQAASLTDWEGDAAHPGYRKLIAAIADFLGPSPAAWKQEAEAEKRREAEEEEARNQAEAEAKLKAQQEAVRRKAEEEAKRKAEEEAASKKAERAEARKKAQAEAKRRADEEAARKKAEEEAARQKVEAEAKRKAEEKAKRKAELDAELGWAKAEEEKWKKTQATKNWVAWVTALVLAFAQSAVVAYFVWDPWEIKTSWWYAAGVYVGLPLLFVATAAFIGTIIDDNISIAAKIIWVLVVLFLPIIGIWVYAKVEDSFS